jgi:hypothetical protein
MSAEPPTAPGLVSPGPPTDDRGVGWHLCGVGIKDRA